MSLKDRFTKKTNTDNQHEFIQEDWTDEIVIGGTSWHTYELPFKYDDVAKSGQIIYKQGLEEKLRIDITEDMITEGIHPTHDAIQVDLLPLDTLLFDNNNLDIYSQIKIITLDDEVIYDEPHKIILKAPLIIDQLVGGEENA